MTKQPDPNSKRSKGQREYQRRQRRLTERKEAQRQERVRAAMLIVGKKLRALREIERILSLASADVIPCQWADDVLTAARAEGAEHYLGLSLNNIRVLCCGHWYSEGRPE